MIEAAENRDLCLAELKDEAGKWAKGLACCLHGEQKSVAMGVLGTVALYRKGLDACVLPIVGMSLVAPFDELARQHYDRANGGLESAMKAEGEESDLAAGELAAQVKLEEEQLRVIQEKEMALLVANEKRIAVLEERVLLLLERLELLLELDKVKATKEALVAELEGSEQ